MPESNVTLSVLLDEARACRICEADLPRGPRPLLQGSATARILIVGQAPGAEAHTSGVPWDDRSGRRLRDWLGLDDAQFYDARLVGLMPMGFCYPGRGRSGDLPPRAECAPQWHGRLIAAFRGVRLTIFVGRHAFSRYLASDHPSLTDAVAAHDDLLPDRVALPHPSPRNNVWLARHAWFERDVLPALRARIATLATKTGDPT